MATSGEPRDSRGNRWDKIEPQSNGDRGKRKDEGGKKSAPGYVSQGLRGKRAR
jgi:hypothetical protein